LRYIVWFAAFVVVAPTAWYCWRKRIAARVAAIVGITSLVVPAIVVPSLAVERVDITDREMILTTGFWFSPTRKSVSLQDVRVIEERLKSVRQRAVDRKDWFWIFHYGTLAPKQVRLPDLLSSNRAPVLEFFRKRGIEIKNA
jgi:hypothetical protein